MLVSHRARDSASSEARKTGIEIPDRYRNTGPTVWNSLPNNLRNPAVGPDQCRRNL